MLIENADDWYSGLHLGKLVGLLFTDLKNTFDTIDRKILCKKLDHYGVKQRALSRFELSYPTVSSFVGLMKLIKKLGTCELVCRKVHALALFSPSST